MIIIRNFISTLKRYQTSSVINIIGLALAFASLYIVLVQLNYDFGYNKGIKDYERIYRLETPDWEDPAYFTFFMGRPRAERIIANLPQIEYGGMGKLAPLKGSAQINKNGEIHDFNLTSTFISLPLIDVMGFDCLQGKFDDLAKPATVAITLGASKRLNVKIGDNLTIGNERSLNNEYTIVAIYKDFPTNSDIGHFDAVINVGDKHIDNDGVWQYSYYIKPHKNVNIDTLESLMRDQIQAYINECNYTQNDNLPEILLNSNVRLNPIKNTYFHEGIRHNMEGVIGNRSTSYTLFIVALLIVIIALINFINFFFALVPRRIKAINTFKIFGCQVASIKTGIVLESIGMTAIAILGSCFLIELLKTSVVAEFISTPFNIMNNLSNFGLTVVIAIVIGFISGIYPAFYITSFPPVMVIKGGFSNSQHGRILRTTLIGLQFIISISLIISTIFIRLQITYMSEHNMGFDKSNIVSVELPNDIWQNTSKSKLLDENLRKSPIILDVTWTSEKLLAKENVEFSIRPYKENPITFWTYLVAPNFLNFFGIDIAEGRDFNFKEANSDEGSIIFNQFAQKKYNLQLNDQVPIYHYNAEIVGFCNNFNFMSLHHSIEPLALHIDSHISLTHMYIKVAPSTSFDDVCGLVRTEISNITSNATGQNVSLQFIADEQFVAYNKELNLSSLITIFSILSIVISLMGVFGLVMFETQYRRKEIGLRRVHGASVWSILWQLNRKYAGIISICFIAAIPINYYIMSLWLSSYSCRTPLRWWVFALAYITVLLITVVTVTIRSYRAATENPSDSIKPE